MEYRARAATPVTQSLQKEMDCWSLLTENWKLGSLVIRSLVCPLNSKNAFLCRCRFGHGFIFCLLYTEMKRLHMHKHPPTHMLSGMYVRVGKTQQVCVVVYVREKSPVEEPEVCAEPLQQTHCVKPLLELSRTQSNSCQQAKFSIHEKAATRLSSKIQMFFLYIIASWHINTAL